MSKKNVARTAIEPGRTGECKSERRVATRAERHAVRQILHCAGEDDPLLPRRERPHLEQADKIGPARRWVASRCGRPWSDVYSELVRRFDPRTLAGRHILYDHLLRSEIDRFGESGSGRGRDFVIDEAGTLRDARRVWSRAFWPRRARPEEVKAACRWLGDRRIGARGSKLFWFVRGESEWRRCANLACPRQHHTVLLALPNPAGCRKRKIQVERRLCWRPSAGYRQHVALSPSERAAWERFAPEVRAQLWVPKTPSATGKLPR